MVLAVLTALASVATTAQAGLIIGDIAGNQASSGYNVGGGSGLNNAIAEGFTMTSTLQLGSVKLILANFVQGTGGNLRLSIFSNSPNNLPGSNLYDLSTNVTGTTSGTTTIATFTASTPFTLTAGTTYWLDLYSSNPGSSSASSVTWVGEVKPPTSAKVNPTGPDATDVGQLRSIGGGNSFSGTPSTTDLRTGFEIVAEDVAVVPEPSTIIPGGFTLLAGLGYARRSRTRRAA